jgi:hypothetical protein
MDTNGDSDRPVSNGSNGRLPDGRFGVGNRGGPGNPNALKTHRLRAALLDATTPEEVSKVVKALVEKATAGDTAACKVFLDHTCGRAPQSIEVSGLEAAGSDLARLRTVILEALADDPAARFKVARALLNTGAEADERRDDAGDGN